MEIQLVKIILSLIGSGVLLGFVISDMGFNPITLLHKFNDRLIDKWAKKKIEEIKRREK